MEKQNKDNIYMARCLELARSGLSFVAPNPMVGSVIVYKDRVIGEGFHRQYGKAHAEVNAIASVKDSTLLEKSTMYVSLEPCSHYGKTPPCAQLIIKKKIPRVVVACLDPFPQVSGRGVQMLRDAGVEVVVGVLEKEAKLLNKAFITFQLEKRPYIILKWAESKDGFIDKKRINETEDPVQFSSVEKLRENHKMRTEVGAILVGTHTALLDNPSLTVRYWEGKQPLRVVVDKDLKIPEFYSLLDNQVPTLVFTFIKKEEKENIKYCILDKSKDVLLQVLQKLYDLKINTLLVEGGSLLLSSFIQRNLWDEIYREKADFLLTDGVKAPLIEDLNRFLNLDETSFIKKNLTLKYDKY